MHAAVQQCRFGASCKYSHQETNLVKLIRHLQAARSTLDICVFNITLDDITAAISDAHKRGVRVRIITDDEQVLVPLGSLA
jgi:mitochondrial cardiolipin hydrolase